MTPVLPLGRARLGPPPDPPIPGKPTPVPDAPPGGGDARVPKLPPDGEKDRRRTPRELAGYTFDKAEVRRVIEKRFRIYDERDALPGFDRALLVAFYVHADRATIERELPILQEELHALDPQLAPMFREEGGETLIIVARRPAEVATRSSALPLALFLATLLTLTASGSLAWVAYTGKAELLPMLEPRNIAYGFLTFTLPMLFYFGVQEVARRLVARRHKLRLGWSVLIPLPPLLFIPSIGTFGSMTRAKLLPANRRALFDLAATGPIAGFLAALILVAVGLHLTLGVGVMQPDDAVMTIEVMAPDGTAWREAEWEGHLFTPFARSVPDDPHRQHNVTIGFDLLVAGRDYGDAGWNLTILLSAPGDPEVEHVFTWAAEGAAGEVLVGEAHPGVLGPGEPRTFAVDLPPGTERLVASLEYTVPARTTVPLGEPLAFRAVSALLVPEDSALVLHPVALAGWGALLVTGIILLPVGRLDGGGVARAVLGDRMTFLGYLTIAALALLSFFYAGWVYLLLFIILFVTVRHPVPLDDTTVLSPGRRALVLLLVALLVLSFVPIPVRLPGLGLLG